MDGFSNLSAMEIDPNGSIQDLLRMGGEGAEEAMAMGGVGDMMQDLAFSVSWFLYMITFQENILRGVNLGDGRIYTKGGFRIYANVYFTTADPRCRRSYVVCRSAQTSQIALV